MNISSSYSDWEDRMPDEMPFAHDPSLSLFEKSSHNNGGTFWLASVLLKLLGYDSIQQLRPAIARAQTVCGNLSVPVEDHFIGIQLDDGTKDIRLTRFACYLVSMNADVKKPEVSKAQAYFITIAESVRRYQDEVENVHRVQLRGEITTKERSLSGVAKGANVETYALFQNAGYRGMYNMNLFQLRELRDIPVRRSPLDYMGKSELAANLFRITQTEERIKNRQVTGQGNLESAAEYVGKKVRETMITTSGTAPEHMAPADDIKVVKKEIRGKKKKFDQIDKPKKKK